MTKPKPLRQRWQFKPQQLQILKALKSHSVLKNYQTGLKIQVKLIQFKQYISTIFNN